MLTRDAYIQKVKHQLDEMNTNMETLEAKAKEVRKAARARFKLERDALHQQSKLAVAKLDELKASGDDSWDSVVAEMENVRDAFVQSFKEFKSQV